MKYVAFLRAINVGGANVVKMDRLRALFEEMGFANVETFIASGNVIFDSTAKSAQKLEAKIEAALATALGFEVNTFLRTAPELAAVAAYKPFSAKELDNPESTLYIGFLDATPPAEIQRKLLTLRSPADDFHIAGREVYWLRRQKLSDTNFSIEKALGQPTTLRNVNTVRKLAAKYC